MRIGILTDLHLRQPGSPPDGWHNPHQFETARERLAAAIAFLREAGVERLVVLGDLTHDGDEDTFSDVAAILATADMPVWIVPGNHDLSSGTQPLTTALTHHPEPIRLLEGSPVPLTSSWQAIGVGLTQGTGGYLVDPSPDPAVWNDHPTLVLSHFPLLSLREEASQANLKYAGDPLNGPEIATELGRRNAPTLIVSGHLHIRHAQARGPVLQASCGALIESLFEATVLDLNAWPDGIVRWQATPIQPVWPGVVPALSESIQAWQWDDTGWQVLTS